jgi:hypothetical protein
MGPTGDRFETYTLDRYTVHDGEIVGWLYVRETPGGNWTDWVVRHLDGGMAGHTSVEPYGTATTSPPL